MAAPATKEELHLLVARLPESEIISAARFLEYLAERRPTAAGASVDKTEPQEEGCPTVAVPMSAVRELVRAIPDVPGNSLADTESLYDEL